MTKKIKAAVVGATGYTGEETVYCLSRNHYVEIVSLSSRTENPLEYAGLFPRFKKRVAIPLKKIDVEEISELCDVAFLALPHTESMRFAGAFLEKGKKVIDLSADFRLPADVYAKWYKTEHLDAGNLPKAVYGLPELNREQIKKAELVANPGCYPTSVILGLLPLIKTIAKDGLTVIVDAKSGATGAGRKAEISLSYSEVDETLKCYKPNAHQHIPEMEYVLGKAAGKEVRVNFAPHLVPLRRGILSTIYIPHKNMPEEEALLGIYREHYKMEPFVRICGQGTLPQISDVAGTNFCDIGIKVSRGMVVIVSVVDNLLKGASGQAVQNMNIMYGLDEKAGLE